MLPEERLEEAIKQTKLAQEADGSGLSANGHYRKALEHLRAQRRMLRQWRDEVDDSEVVD